MRLILKLLLLLVALAACSPSAPITTPETEPAAPSERPSSAAGDDFRADDVAWVANTGRPQLIEVFSYD